MSEGVAGNERARQRSAPGRDRQDEGHQFGGDSGTMPHQAPRRPSPNGSPGAGRPSSQRTPVRRPGPEPRYAGFWIRLAAYVIDSIVALGILIAVAAACALVQTAIEMLVLDGREIARSPGPGITRLLFALGWVTYNVLMTTGSWQATLGKRLCGIYVIQANGSRMSRGAAIGRHFARTLSEVIIFIGLIMAAFTKQKRGLHDMICDTRVVHGKL